MRLKKKKDCGSHKRRLQGACGDFEEMISESIRILILMIPRFGVSIIARICVPLAESKSESWMSLRYEPRLLGEGARHMCHM